MNQLSRFQRRCRQVRHATTAVWLGLALLLVLPYLAMPLVLVLADGEAGTDGWCDLLLSVVHVLPGACYLWGLWAVRTALGELALGRLFDATVARALRRIGGAVMAGALLSVFAVTNLTRLIEGGRGGYAYFDLSGITLAVIGAALVLLARLVEQARRMQAELDGIL